MFTHNIEAELNIAKAHTNSIKTYSSLSSNQLQKSNITLDIDAQVKRALFNPMHNSSKLRYVSQLDKLKEKTKNLKGLEKHLTSSFAQLGIKMTLNRDVLKQLPELKIVNSTGNEFVKSSISLVDHYEKILQRILEREEASAKGTYEIVTYMDKRITELLSEVDLLKKEAKDTPTIPTGEAQHQSGGTLQHNETLKLQSVIMMKEKCIQDLKTDVKRKNGHLRYLWLNHQYTLKEAHNVALKVDEFLIQKDNTIKNINKVLENSASPQTAMGSIKEILTAHFKEQPHESHLESSVTTTARKQLNRSFLRSVREFKNMIDERHRSVFDKQTKLIELEKSIKQEEGAYEEKEFDLKMYKNVQGTIASNPNISDIIEEKEKQLRNMIDNVLIMKRLKEELNKDVTKLKDEVKLIYKTNQQKFRNLDYQVRQALYDFRMNSKMDKYKVIAIGQKYGLTVPMNRRIKHLLKKYKELQSIEDFLYKYELIQSTTHNKLPEQSERIRISKSLTNIAGHHKNNAAILSEIESSVEKQFVNYKSVVEQKEGSIFKISDFVEDIKKLNELLKKDLEDSQKLAIMKSTSTEKLKQLTEGIQRRSDELKMIENIDMSDLESLNQPGNMPSNLGSPTDINVDEEKKRLKTKIIEIERMIQSKTLILEDTLSKIMVIEEANQTLKQQLEDQFKKIKTIYQDSMQRQDLLQDLLKKDKIFDQLYNYQAEKINVKDKKILVLEEKLRDYESQIRNLKKRFSSSKDIQSNKGQPSSQFEVSSSKYDKPISGKDLAVARLLSTNSLERQIASPLGKSDDNERMLLQKIEDQTGILRNQEQLIAKLKQDLASTAFRKSRTAQAGEENDLESVLKRFETLNHENDYIDNCHNAFPESIRSIKNDLNKYNMAETTIKDFVVKQQDRISQMALISKKFASVNSVVISRMGKLHLKVSRLRSNFSSLEKNMQISSNIISIFQKALKCEMLDVRSQSFEYQLTQHIRKLMNTNKKDDYEIKYQQMKSVNLTLETDLESFKSLLNRVPIILKESGVIIEPDEDIELALEKLQRFLYQKSKVSKELETRNKHIKELKEQIAEYLTEIDEKSKEVEALEDSFKIGRQELVSLKKKYTIEKKEITQTQEDLKKEVEVQKEQLANLNAAVYEKNMYIGQLQKTISKFSSHAEKNVISFRYPEYQEEVSMDNLKIKEQNSELFGNEKSISIESSKEFFGLKNESGGLAGFTKSNGLLLSKEKVPNRTTTADNKRNFVKKTSDDSSPEIIEGFKMLHEGRSKDKNIFDESSANLDSILGGKKNLESFQLNSEHSIGNILNANRDHTRKINESSRNKSHDDSDSFEELLKPKILDQKDEPVIQKPTKETLPISLNDIKLFNFKKS